MTQDEIIHMAREAGCYEKYKVCYFVQEDLERFAALVAAHEREACARVCDEVKLRYQKADYYNREAGANECAAAIRARGEK